jgi:PKD repeat protein
VREEIINAVSTGKTVVIPQRDVTQGRWVGTGYIIQDPVTGAGAYLIEGGYNGGTWEGCTITVQASVYRQGFIYGALSALQDTFEQLQAELTARLKAEMAVSKQLRENRTQVEQLNQLLDLTVKLFVGALTALGVEPLINGNGCLVAKAKRAVDEVYVTNELFVLLDRNPQTDKYEAMVDFTAEGITRCSNYQWEVNPPINVSSNQQSFTHTFTDYNKYTATVTATCQGSTTNLSAKINVTVVKIDIKQNENVITGKMQKEIVGRKVSLVGEVKPDRLIFNSQWDIPERVIKDYKIEVGQNPPDRPSGSPAEYPKSGEKVTLSPDDKHKKMVAFYWIDGGKGVPQTQRVNYSITVPNGSQFVVDTTFEVYKPVLPEIKTEVDIVRLSPRIDIDGKGVNLWLAYGAPDNGGKVGIEFRVDFSKKDPMIPPDFGKGQFQWVQLVKQTEREEVEDEEPQKPGVYNRCWKTYQHDDYRLDSLFPYPGFYDGDIFYTSDSPASGPLSYQLAIERHGEFKMWLMYTPAGVIEGENKNVIPVPLAKVDWRWRAIAWKGDGILWGARSTYEVLLPYQKKPNEPTPSLSDAGPLFQETIEYPTWVTNSNPLYPGRHQSIKFQPEVCPSSSDKR